MTTDVVSRGSRRTVALRKAGNAWAAVVDGRQVPMDACRVGGRWSVLIGVAGATGGGGRSYDVAIERHGGGQRVAHVNGHALPLALADVRTSLLRRTDDAVGAGAAAWRLVVPMPGRVVKLFVRPGDVVAAGQGLVVVEAMKMENELRAPRAGVVADVRVREGAAVEANAVLLVLDGV